MYNIFIHSSVDEHLPWGTCTFLNYGFLRVCLVVELLSHTLALFLVFFHRLFFKLPCPQILCPWVLKYLIFEVKTVSKRSSAMYWGSCYKEICMHAQSCLTLCDSVICSIPGFLHYLPSYLPEFAQTHIHWVGDAIQPFHSLSPPSPPVLILPQHQGLLISLLFTSGGYNIGDSA